MMVQSLIDKCIETNAKTHLDVHRTSGPYHQTEEEGTHAMKSEVDDSQDEDSAYWLCWAGYWILSYARVSFSVCVVATN